MNSVSIIIPTHNQQSFVIEAIESALAQTHPAVDVVVVNDGSTDQTRAMLGRYAKSSRVQVIHQPCLGLPAARNKGLEAARGEFVCFLDSDDFLAAAYVTALLAPLTSDPALAFAYSDVQMVDRGGLPSSDFSVGESRRVLSGDIFDSLLLGGYFPPHAVLARRGVVDELGGFAEDLGGHADYEMWLRIAASGGRAAYVDERLAFYRVYDGTMSRDLDHMRQSRVDAIDAIARRYPKRLAAALSAVQELHTDLHSANTFLRQRWEHAIADAGARTHGLHWSLIDHLASAKLASGSPDQLGVWDTTIGGVFDRALFLHPPSELEIVIPTGAAGRLETAAGLYPDVWENPRAGGCAFTISVDDSVGGMALLDPVRRAADRRWVRLGLDVPGSDTGAHVVKLGTQSVRSREFAWALFRDVRFHWS